ncbi:Protein YIF1B [Eufriesea mexicana]|uniref:Protein YIF1 n=1 Tax=Eufriesea mexicana TaxID=516756 RepID=A0A310SMM3_9HYME|nr:Protein YIF1B [Eufriesea mexicana]
MKFLVGKSKRLLDPSAGLSTPTSTPTMPQGAYAYNQQIPMDNGVPQEYGFNVSGQQPAPYGFNMSMPMQQFPPGENLGNEYSSPQFGSQMLGQPIVTNMALHYGTSIVGSGKRNFEKYVPVTALKYYFAVDTDYVVSKIALLFFPFTHKDWSVKYEQDAPLQPRYEKNAPDMYIPTMAFLTYIVVAALVSGTREQFTPEQLSILASTALAWSVLELVVHILLAWYRFPKAVLWETIPITRSHHVEVATYRDPDMRPSGAAYWRYLYQRLTRGPRIVPESVKLLVSTGGPSWAVAGQDRHFPSQPHGVELNHPCGLTVDGTSPSASMCPCPSRVRLRQRTAQSRSEDALIRGGHPGTRCMTRLTVTGNECRRRVVRMTYVARSCRVHGKYVA